jgi:serine/threonine-protein kinase
MKLCPKCQKQFSDDANFCPVDAARLMPLEAQAAGPDALAARFDLGERIGGAHTGAVHRATDKQTGRPCAVKLVSRAVVALPGVAQRLERELKQLERVQSAGVAHVIASGKRGDEIWLATELLEGAQTLAAAIGARGAIPLEQATELVEVIGEALIEAAQVGVVHRDLAPKNVLFAGQDVKLINFSLPLPVSDKVPGAPEFVAPEQVEGKPVDQRSNLYSLGALYYYVLTGQPLFAGAPEAIHQQHVSGTIRPPSQLAQVPATVEALLMRALDRSPTKRFLTVRQFVDEVGKVGRSDVIELKSATKAARPKGPLVSTLMGIKTGLPSTAGAPTAPPMAAPPMAAPPMAAPPMAAPPMAGATMAGAPGAMPPSQLQRPSDLGRTVLGVPAGHLMSPGQMMAPAAATPAQPVAPAPGQPSPWSPPPPSGMAPAPMAQMAPQMAPPMAAPQMTPMAQMAPPVAPPSAQMAPQVAPQMAAPQMTPMAQMAPPVAPPMVAPPMVAAPVVAAPVVGAPAAGRKKPEDANKGKFRETMWFKKGDLDAQAAVAAAEERARTGQDVATDKIDTLPIDERYKDDGSITHSDKDKYSLRTGATMMMQRVDAHPDPKFKKVSEDALIGEMKSGRKWVVIGIVIAIVVVVAVLLVATR